MPLFVVQMLSFFIGFIGLILMIGSMAHFIFTIMGGAFLVGAFVFFVAKYRCSHCKGSLFLRIGPNRYGWKMGEIYYCPLCGEKVDIF